MKTAYKTPSVEVSSLTGMALFCASNQGNNEDFEKGSGFSFDLFEGIKSF